MRNTNDGPRALNHRQPMVAVIPPEPSEAILIDLMKVMREMRIQRLVDHIGTTLSGWGEDPRELIDIPEVRETCQHLIDTGFVSYLDFSTSIKPPQELIGTLGAMEVFLIATNRRNPEITEAFLAEVETMLGQANLTADAVRLIEDALS
ncbi:MAG: hypothetical protein LC104_06780 [Bacteroidales bacterium]|nr:hypothetical protein [Bacteroidales bacterium]